MTSRERPALKSHAYLQALGQALAENQCIEELDLQRLGTLRLERLVLTLNRCDWHFWQMKPVQR